MAYVWDIHTTPAQGAEAIYDLLQVLLSIGATVTKSGTGNSMAYSAGGNIITGFAVTGSVAGSIGNINAWFCVRLPDGREFTFQNLALAAQTWRVKYSKASGFVIGTPANNQTPQAADEVVLIGAGTDAAPTSSGATFAAAGSLNKVTHFADNAVPYSFGFVGWTGVGVINTGFVHCGLVVGTYPAGDVDPRIQIWGPSGLTFGAKVNYNTNSAVNLVRGWMGANNLNLAANEFVLGGSTTTVPRGVGSTNPIDGLDYEIPIYWSRAPGVSTPGPKGFSNVVQWCGVNRPSLATLSIGSSKDRLVVNDFTIPWCGIDPVL